MPAFYNRATLLFGGSAIDSNTVRGEISAALAIGKDAVQRAYRPGDSVTYAVTLTNSGANDADRLTLRDDLGDYAFGSGKLRPLELVDGSLRYFINGEAQVAPAAEIGGDGMTLREIRVPAGGSAMILYAARVNEFAPLGEGTAIVNTVRLDDEASASFTLPAGGSGAMANPGATANPVVANPNAGAAMPVRAAQPVEDGAPALPAFASAQIEPDVAARLSIGKSLSPEVVEPGQPVTYTLTIENEGASPVAAQDGAVITDSFNPRMDIRSVRFNGAEWSSPANYSYDPNTGLFSTLPGQIALPGASFRQDAGSGRWQTEPGVAILEITGTLR